MCRPHSLVEKCLPTYHDNKALLHTSRHCYLHRDQIQTPRPQGGGEERGGRQSYKQEREWVDVTWRCHQAGRHTQRHSLAAAVTMGMHLTANRYDSNTTDTVWLATIFSHTNCQVQRGRVTRNIWEQNERAVHHSHRIEATLWTRV